MMTISTERFGGCFLVTFSYRKNMWKVYKKPRPNLATTHYRIVLRMRRIKIQGYSSIQSVFSLVVMCLTATTCIVFVVSCHPGFQGNVIQAQTES